MRREREIKKIVRNVVVWGRCCYFLKIMYQTPLTSLGSNVTSGTLEQACELP